MIEQPIRLGLRARLGRGGEWARRLAIDSRRRNLDQLPLRPAQRRELAAEDAARVDADRVIDPFRIRRRRMAIDDSRAAAIIRRPIEPHRQAELIRLARRLAEQRELADSGRAAADHLLLQPGMGDGELAAVEPIMTAKIREESFCALAELGGLLRELIDRLLKPMADCDLSAFEPARQFAIMIALHDIGDARLLRLHGDAQHARHIRPAIDEIADEDQLAAMRGRDGDRIAFARDDIAERCDQQPQFVDAAMHVADHIEGADIVALVGPHRAALDGGRLDRLDRGQLPDLPKAFIGEAAQAATNLLNHALRHAGPEIAIRPRLVTLDADIEARIDDDRHWQRVPAPRELDPGLAIGGAHIGGVDHREPAVLQPFLGDCGNEREGVGRGRLVGLVVADETAAIVRGDHLRRFEPARREARFSCARRADQHDEAEIGNVQEGRERRIHLENTATCVTGPRSGCSSPMPEKATE